MINAHITGTRLFVHLRSGLVHVKTNNRVRHHIDAARLFSGKLITVVFGNGIRHFADGKQASIPSSAAYIGAGPVAVYAALPFPVPLLLPFHRISIRFDPHGLAAETARRHGCCRVRDGLAATPKSLTQHFPQNRCVGRGWPRLPVSSSCRCRPARRRTVPSSRRCAKAISTTVLSS